MAKKRKNARAPVNGYVVYPSSRGFMSLAAAKKAARQDAKDFGHGRVERTDNEKIVYRAPKGNPPLRKGKTNRWISGKAFKVVRKKGKLTVMVKR